MPTLIVSNDFPPRIGGIESYVRELCRLLDDQVVVLTSRTGDRDGEARHDAGLGFPVVRHARVLLPTPTVGRRAAELLVRHRATRVVFGAAAPLSLLGPGLRAAGAKRIVALSHGHETWWARLPGPRGLLARMVAGVDAFGVISDFTAGRIAAVLPERDRAKLVRLPPPVDLDRFSPADPDDIGPDRGRPRCVAVGRFVRQKGFDTLLSAWRQVLDGPAGPLDPELLLVGDGPQRRRLELRRDALALGAAVRFTGAVAHEQLPDLLRSADVFALPVRTRWSGLNPEGLGLGFVEAAAAGLPVLVGRSGGAPETVLDEVSGFVVDPDDPTELAARLTRLLTDPGLARRMGSAGRGHAERFGSDRLRSEIRALLDLD